MLSLALVSSFASSLVLSACLPSSASASAQAPAATVEPQGEDFPPGERGLPISAPVPAFDPLHLTGPHAGKVACPLCVYGLVPQLQIWVQEAHLDAGLPLARQAEAMCARSSGKLAPVPYVILVPAAGERVSASTERLVRDSNLTQVFFVQVPSWEDAKTSGLYGHSDKDKPGVRTYVVVNRRLFQRWDDPREEHWQDIEKSVAEAAAFVSTHDITDAQIAPSWEPGKRLQIEFRVVNARGEPMRGVKVSAWQTDVQGHYSPPGWNRRQPRLTALAWTDEDGRITFRTIMPGSYPSSRAPAHIHFGAEVRGRPRWRTLMFEGDPHLTSERPQSADQGEETVVVPIEEVGGVMRVRHTFGIGD